MLIWSDDLVRVSFVDLFVCIFLLWLVSSLYYHLSPSMVPNMEQIFNEGVNVGLKKKCPSKLN